MQESKLRQVVRYQEYFERPTDRRKRKKKDALYHRFLDYKRRTIRKAYDLKEEQQNVAKDYLQI